MCMCAYVHMRLCRYLFVCVYVRICTCVYAHINLYVLMCVCACVWPHQTRQPATHFQTRKQISSQASKSSTATRYPGCFGYEVPRVFGHEIPGCFGHEVPRVFWLRGTPGVLVTRDPGCFDHEIPPGVLTTRYPRVFGHLKRVLTPRSSLSHSLAH